MFKGTTQVGFKQIRIRLITPPRFRFNLAQTIQREITILQSILYWIRSRRGQRRRQQVPELAEDEDMEAEAVLSELQSFERDIEEYGEGRGSRNLMEHLWQRSKSIRDKLGRLLHLLAEYGNEQIKQETRKIITLDDIREFFLNLITGTKLESPTFRINLIKGLTPEEMRELIRRFREERGVTEEHEEIPGAPHPHDLTPTVEHPIVSEPQPFLDVITFLNDLYTALRQKMWGRVSSLLGFALNQNRLGQKILEVGQISFLRNLSDSLESTNFQRAGDILNSANAREIFRQNPQILEELKRIVEEIRRESEGEEPSGPAPPASPVPPSAPTTGGAERLRRMADRLRGRRPPA
ncbi:hypothetical protein HYX04_01435 [Candidatus Woesearchaeota archaeon]|nr:hypothetical protein [Candidatus Woesearchaeota archaeon]